MVDRVERAKMAVFLCAILTKLERLALMLADALTSAVHISSGVKLRKIMQICKL